MARNEEPALRVPKQHDGSGAHGVSGYRGDVEVYDPNEGDETTAQSNADDVQERGDKPKSRSVAVVDTKARKSADEDK